MCTISDSFLVSMSHLALVAEQPKPDYCRQNSGFRAFFCSLEVVHKTVCTIFAQLVFHPKNRAQKRALFPKTTLPYKNSGLRPKRHLKITNFYWKNTFLGVTNWQLVEQVFGCYWEGNPLLKSPIFIVFFENRCQKTLIFCRVAKKHFFERCWITSQSSLIGPKPQNRNTLIDTKICPKNPQKNLFL